MIVVYFVLMERKNALQFKMVEVVANGFLPSRCCLFLSHFLFAIALIAHCLFVPQSQRAMPPRENKKATAPMRPCGFAPKTNNPKLRLHNTFL
jgi:hypothetical protein